MDAELHAFVQQNTWFLVPPTPSLNVTGKWLFKVKTKADGSIKRYKARLVAKGIN